MVIFIIITLLAVVAALCHLRLLRWYAGWKQHSQAEAVAAWFAHSFTPFRMELYPDVAIDQEAWKRCLNDAILSGLRRAEEERSVLRITHNVFQRPDPLLAGATRRAFGSVSDKVSRALVPIEIWFSDHFVKARFANQFADAGVPLWVDDERMPLLVFISVCWSAFQHHLTDTHVLAAV